MITIKSVNFRKLNTLIIPDNHSLPRIEDTSNNLRNNEVFITLNMSSGV